MLTPRQAFAACLSGPWDYSPMGLGYRVEGLDDEVRVVFEYTHDRQGWEYDFDAVVEPYKDMPVRWLAHKGFVDLWKSARKDVMGRVASLIQAKPRPVSVMGYSQGAAVAVLGYEDCTFSLPKSSVSGMAFGTPRVLWGLPTIAERFTGFHRWNVRGDLVHMVPPGWMGYRHVGHSHKVGPVHVPWPWRHEPRFYEAYLP